VVQACLEIIQRITLIELQVKARMLSHAVLISCERNRAG
jgi:hypothetical protein